MKNISIQTTQIEQVRSASNLSPQLRSALNAARRGWLVIAVHGRLEGGGCGCGNPACNSTAKHPLTSHGLLDGTSDITAIQQWWNRSPDANVGFVTGAQSGIVALDIDPRHGGLESLRELEEQYGHLPDGPRVRTGGGGEHIFFRHPGGHVKSRAGVAPGIDVRGDGGYVVVPGSVHSTGKSYVWEHGKTPSKLPLPPIPDWLLKKLQQQPPQQRSEMVTDSQPAIREGKRNSTLASLAGTMRKRGLAQEAITAALLIQNRERCEPPLDEGEVERIAASIGRYEPEVEQQNTARSPTLEGLPVKLSPEQEIYITRWERNPVSGVWAVRLFEAFFNEFLILPNGMAFVLALWAIATHTFDTFDCFPYLGVTSPTKRCGKTRVAEILELLCARALMSVNVSEAALFRSIEAEQPTVIIDEAESLRNKNSERAQYLLSLLQSGFRKGAVVIRCDGKNHDVRKFPVYCPKAVLAIGNLPDTLRDRSILVSMRRRLKGEHVDRFRRRAAAERALGIRILMNGWLRAHAEKIAEAYRKQKLDFLQDREADIWEPIFATASVAVPERLKELEQISLQLSSEKNKLDVDNSRGIRLLADVREVFEKSRRKKLETEQLILKLGDLPENPWGELNATRLARLLRPFGIAPRQMWIDEGNRRGYDSADFEQAFAAYLPPRQALETLEPA